MVRALSAQLTCRVRGIFASGTAVGAAESHTAKEGDGPPPGQKSLSQRELTAVRLEVNQMREELQSIRAREERASYRALHDRLTALPNRRYFLENLRTAFENQGAVPANLAVIHLRLDGFKELNEAHGHHTGDQLLKFVAARLVRAGRPEDLVSRLGGDEFACLITGVSSRERLQHMAAAVFDAVSTPFKVGQQVLRVHPGIGIALSPADGTTSETLLQAAAVAMYAARRERSTSSFAQRSRPGVAAVQRGAFRR